MVLGHGNDVTTCNHYLKNKEGKQKNGLMRRCQVTEYNGSRTFKVSHITGDM